MAAATDNPNLDDLPDDLQVMRSPSAATAREDRIRGGHPQVNGVDPLRGTQDIDGELITLPAEAQVGPRLLTASQDAASSSVTERQPVGTAVPLTESAVGPRGALASGPLGLPSQPDVAPGPPRTSSVVMTEVRGQAQIQGSSAGGVISGVLRAVQTLPAAMETLVSRSDLGLR